MSRCNMCGGIICCGEGMLATIAQQAKQLEATKYISERADRKIAQQAEQIAAMKKAARALVAFEKSDELILPSDPPWRRRQRLIDALAAGFDTPQQEESNDE